METYTKLYTQICSKENLLMAWKKARKKKTQKQYVIDFEKNITENLLCLRTELLLHAYRPKPLENFILRDPKTRKISVSNFRDRVVHHAICNYLEPIFDKKFIYDSYANRKGKGTLAALKRLQQFMHKVSFNGAIVKNRSKNSLRGFVFKADVKHYFDTINHNKLLKIIGKNIIDKQLLFLLKNILNNHASKISGTGMPLGNLTSQFLANVYLNELDQFVKHKLKIKYYIRYVDDFVVLHTDKKILDNYKLKISAFLEQELLIELNSDKSIILPLSRGINFLGFRCFYHHKLLKIRNIRQFYRKKENFDVIYAKKEIDYDQIYNFMEGWIACAKNANTYYLRKKILTRFEREYSNKISTKEVNRSLPKRKKIEIITRR